MGKGDKKQNEVKYQLDLMEYSAQNAVRLKLNQEI